MFLNSAQLWVIATPLGNPGDLSPRAKQILESVDLVLAEDTRRAGLLCQRCNVRVAHFKSYYDHNEATQSTEIIPWLKAGHSAALISDAGTPLIADPGYRLVRACRAAHISVSMVPGPCAPVAALMASGIAPLPFTFLGFPPRGHAEREAFFAPFTHIATTLVFFERKDRLRATLKVAHALLGSRELAIARELTKVYEEFILTHLENYADIPQNLLGEITVILGPPCALQRTPQEDVCALLRKEYTHGGKPRDIAHRVQAMVTGWTSKEIYRISTDK